MKRHYYISNSLDELEAIERELEAEGVTIPQIHVLSEDDAGVEQHRLHQVEAVLKKDVVHGTERGALIGAAAAAIVLLLCWLSGITEAYSWIPAIFLAVVVLGFCTWEGGLIGIQESHVEFKRFQRELAAGQHVLFVDIDPGQEPVLRRVVARHAGLKAAGEGQSTPRMVVRFQDGWSRFMKLAP